MAALSTAPKAKPKAKPKARPNPLTSVPDLAREITTDAGTGLFGLPGDAVLTIPTGARLLSINKYTLYKAIRAGRLAAFSLGGAANMTRVLVSDLQAWAAQPYPVTGGLSAVSRQ